MLGGCGCAWMCTCAGRQLHDFGGHAASTPAGFTCQYVRMAHKLPQPFYAPNSLPSSGVLQAEGVRLCCVELTACGWLGERMLLEQRGYMQPGLVSSLLPLVALP